ncbi:14095_t:CDS:2 [Ambispora leptoticha]|uniref:14095_t:CDS:1 n=1 Tax=Ambispora leptoticha TaxID=144679 RepID=A0A9N9B4T6_9GLOM|nr:14095_t:CDS:2 [Ambispora leptoticha]
MQIWLLVLAIVVFLLSSATTYIQKKRHAFILICLGVTGQLFSFSIILAVATAGISTATDDALDNFTMLQKVLCGISGSILSAQHTSNFTVSLALSIDLYMTLVKGKEAGKKLKWVYRALCLIAPYLLTFLNILVVVLLNKGEEPSFELLESLSVCQVRTHVANNRYQWTIFLVRIVPTYLPIFPAFVLSFMAIIPFAIKLFETRYLKQPTQATELPTPVQSPKLEYGFQHEQQRRRYSLSDDTIVQRTVATTAANEKILTRSIAGRMYIWCFIVSCLDLPISIMGFIEFFQYDDRRFTGSVKIILELVVHCLIFLVFATGNYANEQYRGIWTLLWNLRRQKASVLEATSNRDKPLHRVSSTAFVGMANISYITGFNRGGSISKNNKSALLISEQSLSIFPSALNSSSSPSLLPTVPRTVNNNYGNNNISLSSTTSTTQSNNNFPNLTTPTTKNYNNENDGKIDITINDEMDDEMSNKTPSSSSLPSVYSGTSNITSTPPRISTSHERHSWLKKPPTRSISPDNLHDVGVWEF